MRPSVVLVYTDNGLIVSPRSRIWQNGEISPPIRGINGLIAVQEGIVMAEKTVLENEVATLIVEALNLEDVKPESIDPEAPLFREGLGLDSIDALELALAISKKYGFKLQSDDKQNSQIFRSLRALASHVEQNRAA